MKNKGKNIVDAISKFYNQNKCLIKPILILTLIFLICFSSIIRADFDYIDDMGRKVSGYRGWSNFSRFLSSFFSIFIHSGKYLTDISPLTQYIACLILAVSGVIILYVFTERKKFKFIEYASVLPIGITPYFLECISYKFDSPYMAFSILFGIFPLLFYKKSKIGYFIASTLGIIMVCTTYQPATGIFPMLVILLSLKNWINKESIKEIFQYFGLSVAGYVLGLGIFNLFIMVPVNDYVSSSITLSLSTVINNYSNYLNLIINDFNKTWFILIGLLCIGFIMSLTINSKKNKIVTFIVSTLSLFLMGLLCFGLYPILSKPLFACRAMYVIGIFIMSLCIIIATSKKMHLFKLVSLILCWNFIVFSFTYGNALSIQKEYTKFRISQTITDLKDIEIFKNEESIKIQITGTIDKSKIVKNMSTKYGILNRIIPVTFSNSNWTWGKKEFEEYYGLKKFEWVNFLDKNDLPMVIDNIYNTIKVKDNCVLIELKN